MSIFSDFHSEVRLFSKDTLNNGLYPNQTGAIGAVLAHFSVRKDPALVAMPTGSGKTAIMVVLSFLLKAQKVLVLTPSVLVRKQIADQFRNPALLITYGVLPPLTEMPRVYELTGIINDADRWRDIMQQHDVVVGIPGTINKINGLRELVGDEHPFDVVFVDEAHHSRAKTWTEVLRNLNLSQQVLLTATPFRADKKEIKARLVYHFPLRMAYEQGLFSRIRFEPVLVDDQVNDETKNTRIAQRAEQVFNSRAHASHRMIIRTDSKSAANQLSKIYQENTHLNLVIIHSELTEHTINQRIEQLRNGEIDGVICVDMMGEGFDFPLLKIAAVHVPHKSLAITLQFIGRISRTNAVAANEATVIAIEHDFKLGAVQLYKKETTDWSIILPDLHLAQVQRREEEQTFFESFEEQMEGENDTPELQVNQPLIENDDFNPFFHVKIYRLSTLTQLAVQLSDEQRAALINIETVLDFSANSIIINPEIKHHHTSQDHSTSIYVIAERQKPDWYLTADVLHDITHHLIIIFYDVTSGLFFICSSLKENELYDFIVEEYIAEGVRAERVLLPHLKRLMADWENPRMYNIGMRNRKTRGNSESYKQLLGSKADENVTNADTLSYTRGHSFGGGFDRVLNKEVMLGISTSSKVWCLDEKRVIYLVQWCRELARKIEDPEMDNRNTPLSNLDAGIVVDDFPAGEIFLADWSDHWYDRLASVAFVSAEGEVLAEALCCSCSISIVHADEEAVTLSIRKHEIESQITCRIQPTVKFNYTDDTPSKMHLFTGRNRGEPEAILSLLVHNPIQLHYEDLSILDGKVFLPSRTEVVTIANDRLIDHVWPADVSVNSEIIAPAPLRSIHDYIIDIATAEFDVVYYDHASLEIADIIAFRAGCIRFYHCKGQEGDAPRCQVMDIYEVNGQAAKSVHWANRKRMLKQLIERADRNQTVDKLRKGTVAEIEIILTGFDNPVIPVEIYIVHPGLKLTNHVGTQIDAFERVKRLLSGTDTYFQQLSQCKLFVLGSA